MYCTVSKRGQLKGFWGRKSRTNFAIFHPCKIWRGRGKTSKCLSLWLNLPLTGSCSTADRLEERWDAKNQQHDITYCMCLLLMLLALTSGWNSGGRMASAEGGSVPSWMGYGSKGVPPADQVVWGNVVSSPPESRAEPRPETDFGVFWRPQNAHFCT